MNRRLEPAASGRSDQDFRGNPRSDILALRLGLALFGLQLVGMVVFSTIQYQRYALTLDFGAYSQAWWSIAHGHLSPSSSLFGVPFWRNNSEFLVWPLSLLHWVFPQPIDLLWAQDLALVATECVALLWIYEYIESSPRGRHPWSQYFLVGAAAVLVADPWAYQTMAFDVHMEPFGALFALLAARTLWRRRYRPLAWWVPLTLITNVLGGLFIAAVGVSGLIAGQGRRRVSAVLGLVGVAWFVILSSIHAAGLAGHGFAGWYGYLAGPHHGHLGVSDVLIGLIRHPGRALAMMAHRWNVALGFVVVVGLVGVFSPWAFPMSVVVIVPSAINANPLFLAQHQSFQTWPVVPFVLVGTAMFLLNRDPTRESDRRIVAGVLAIWLVSLVVLASIWIPDVPRYWLAVDSKAAAQLAIVQREIPSDAEVISSSGVSGRLAERPVIFALTYPKKSFPVERGTIVFVLAPRQGLANVSPSETRRAIVWAERKPGAKVLLAKDGIYAITWHPPGGISRITAP